VQKGRCIAIQAYWYEWMAIHLRFYRAKARERSGGGAEAELALRGGEQKGRCIAIQAYWYEWMAIHLRFYRAKARERSGGEAEAELALRGGEQKTEED
jgi:hypothetical protein